MKAKLLFLFFLIFSFFLATQYSINAQTVTSVPHPTKNYTQTVEEWWNTNPYNPQTTANNYIPVGGITSPNPVVNVCNYKSGSDTAGIEQALAQLPSTGGTLFFDSSSNCSPYIMTKPLNWSNNIYGQGFDWVGNGVNLNILSRNNIHFTSDATKATIVGSFHITSFQFRLNQPVKQKPVRNYYFKNLIFQNPDNLHYSFYFEDVEDILFDNVIFDGSGVYSVVNGNNIFYRNVEVKGATTPSLNFDGSHFTGIINSKITTPLREQVRFWANWDVTIDQDLNGTLDEHEVRDSRYFVGSGNTIETTNPSTEASITIGAFSKVLWKDNILKGPSATKTFVQLNTDNRTIQNTTRRFDYYDYVIKNNTMTNIRDLFSINSPDYVRKGNATLTNNSGNADFITIFNQTAMLGTFETPLTICGNTVNGNLLSGNSSCSGSTPTQPTGNKKYYYGFFEDGQFQTNDVIFTNSINDIKAHNMNAIAFTNTEGNLSVSDSLNFNVIAAPMKVLYESFYKSTTTLTDSQARTLLYPIVDGLRGHSSLIGYNIHDDSIPADNQKMEQITKIFAERDSIHPISQLLITGQLAQEVYDYLNPKAYLSYDFPFKISTTPCQVLRTNKDWVHRQRESFQLKPANDPLWFVLQAHRTTKPNPEPDSDLRQPSPEEMSLQFWEALGEEATGLFWYLYSDAPTDSLLQWTGVKNMPEHYTTASNLGRKLNTIKPYLENSQKIPDRFKISGSNYTSTFKSKTENKYYLIAVNQNCSSQDLSITSDYFNGSLKDLITNETFSQGVNVPFTAGEGRMFEIINPVAKTPPATQTNIIQNPSFEVSSNGKPLAWTVAPDPVSTYETDTTESHTGTSSVKFGSSGYRLSQNVALAPSTYYYISYWAKAQGLTNVPVGIKVYQTSPSIIELTSLNWRQTGSYDWTKRVAFFKTPDTFAIGRIDINWGLLAAQTYWVDDVTLCRMDQPCPDEYLIERLNTTSNPGDADTNNIVDGRDYVIWLNHYNQNVLGPTNGDFNSSGTVDDADYSIWLANYSL